PECRRITHNPYMTEVFDLPHWKNASLTAPPDERPDSFRVYRDGKELPPDQLPMQVACTGVEVRDFEMDVVRTHGDGTRKLLCYVRPLKDAEGRIRGSVGAFLDVTERKQAEEALRASEERFRTLAKATNDAVWDWDLATDKIWCNEGVLTLFGYQLPNAEADLAWWLERIHPDDRAAVEAFFFDIVRGKELSWVDEYRFRCEDGSYKDVYDRGYIIRDANG